MIAASQVAVLPGSPAVKEWVKANNPCPTLFEKWDIITTLKATRDKMSEERFTDPKAEKDFIGFCEIYNLLVTGSKEHSVPTYECEEGKESEVRIRHKTWARESA